MLACGDCVSGHCGGFGCPLFGCPSVHARPWRRRSVLEWARRGHTFGQAAVVLNPDFCACAGGVDQGDDAEGERDGLVVVTGRVVVEPVDAEGVLAEPDRGELVDQVLVGRDVEPVAAEDLVQGQGEPAD